MSLRPDLARIADLVPPGSRVLDLGCGDGELLAGLTREKGCTGTGVEIGVEQFTRALARGLNVIDLNLDSQLDEFTDDSYDIVILSQTLQNVARPREVLAHMGRIALHSIVSMPNFAHWRNRLSLLRGRMPISSDLPFEWYDTPNLHYTSLKDLEPLFDSLGLHVDQSIPLDADGNRLRSPGALANVLASAAIYLLHATR